MSGCAAYFSYALKIQPRLIVGLVVYNKIYLDVTIPQPILKFHHDIIVTSLNHWNDKLDNRIIPILTRKNV